VPNLDESIEELREIADRRNDILAEVGGLVVCHPAAHVGYELIGAGMLIPRGGRTRSADLDYEELERWTRVSGMRAQQPSLCAQR
jgi:hypothetical protein